MLCIIGIITGSCDSQINDDHWFYVIPENDHSLIYKVQDSKLVISDIINYPAPQQFPENRFRPLTFDDSVRIIARSFENISYNQDGWITSITNSCEDIWVSKYDTVKGITTHLSIHLPSGYKAFTTAIADNIVYVGGYCGQEILGLYDLSSIRPTWISLYIPDKIKSENKRIDDLVIYKDKLIAVDDVVFPKWLLLYDISYPKSPRFLGLKEIPNHGVYESVIKADVGLNWFIALSRTSGRFSLSQHIALFNVNNFKEYGRISNSIQATRFAGYPELHNDSIFFWESITLLNNILLIAAGQKGIGIIDLIQIDKSGDVTKQCQEKLFYRKLKNFNDGKVMNIIALKGRNILVPIISYNGTIVTPIVKLEDLLLK